MKFSAISIFIFLSSASALAEAPQSSTTTRMVADARSSDNLVADTARVAQGQYDVTYSICQTVAPADYAVDFVAVANSIIPSMASANYFSNRGISLNPSDSIAVILLDAPKHGVLEHDKYAYGVYLYKPVKDYFGGDRIIFSVEVKGKVFKVIYSVDVVKDPVSGSPSCPTGNGIKELPNPEASNNKHSSNDIFKLLSSISCDAETLANMHTQHAGGLFSINAT